MTSLLHICAKPAPLQRPSDLWVASVLLRLFLCLHTPANFRPYVAGVSRWGDRRLGRLWKGHCSNWEVHFLSACPFIPPFVFVVRGFLLCSAKWQQKLCLHCSGWRVEVRGKSRYKLISLTFQETLLLTLSAPHPHLPQHYSTHTRTWVDRLAQSGRGSWVKSLGWETAWNEAHPFSHSSDNDTTRTLCWVSMVVR